MNEKRVIELQEQNIEYTLRVSRRARRMTLSVYHDGDFVVTVPRMMSLGFVERFIMKKSKWIINKLEYFKDRPRPVFRKNTRQDYLEHKEKARELAVSRLEELNKSYNFKFNRISIRNQRSRWGSCSKKGNLNFNYKIALLPLRLVDYIMVHELCHLGEFNHSPKFWNLVAQTVPDYPEVRKELKKIGLT